MRPSGGQRIDPFFRAPKRQLSIVWRQISTSRGGAPLHFISAAGSSQAPKMPALVSIANAAAEHRFVVQYRGKWVVVLMEQPLPILVSRGLPESLFVRGDIIPADEKKIIIFALEAAQKFMRNIARHGCDDGLRLTECQFKCR